MPLQPPTGERRWLAAVRMLVPALAAAFGPDVIVSQHGADSHAFDPLAHMLVTTTAMGRGGPPRRRDRPPACRRPMAGDGRRWLRRVSGGAPCMVAGLARRRPSRCPGIHTRAMARTLDERSAAAPPGAAPRDLRRPAECRVAGGGGPGTRGGDVRRDRAAGPRHRGAEAAPRRDRRALVVARGARRPVRPAANPFGRRPLAGADDRRQPDGGPAGAPGPRGAGRPTGRRGRRASAARVPPSATARASRPRSRTG